MARFNNLVLTQKGIDLHAKVQTGVELNFTKTTIGDGYLPQGTELQELEALVNEKKTLTINLIAVNEGYATIRSTLTNEGVATGFAVRELGLFANDPDIGEILYAVANAGDYADYLPAYGGAEYIEHVFDIVTNIGNATNVTAVINESLEFVTRQEMIELDPLVNPLINQTITYDDYGKPITVATNLVTYQITYNSDGTLNTISNGTKTMQAQYNEWGQFIGTVIL